MNVKEKDMTELSMKRTRTLDWRKLYTDGLIIDNPDEIHDSLMCREYQQAGRIVCDIIRANEEEKTAQKSGAPDSGYAAYYRRRSVAANGGYLTESEKVSNIISFVGKRGMGKTSVMLSLMNFMEKENRCRSELNEIFPSGELEHISFVVLRYIDTSILKASEDIMTIILARMFRYVRELIDSPYGNGNNMTDQSEVRALFLQFEQVFQSVMTLNDKRPFSEGESALQRLQSLNSSFSLADSFQNLVNCFLDFAARCGGVKQRPYLVIALDDIDRYKPDIQEGELNKNVYTLLGQIDEYLKIPGIIVMATYDEAFLRDNCRRCIKEKYLQPHSSATLNQVEQYLTKVIPNQHKVYMPHLGWEDRVENTRLKIKLDKEGRKFLFRACPDTTENLTAKEMTLCYLADQYGCFFDAAGQKKHFFEEKNLRKLSDLLFVLRLPEQERNSDGGYSKLMSYIYNHFTSFVLNDSEADIFADWVEKPIDRRSKEIFTCIREERAQLPKSDEMYLKDREWDGYNYGGLIYNLYCSTRTGSGAKTIFSKGMVQCILASYSIVLPRIIQDRQNDEIRHKLKGVLGTSISGQWSNAILPTVFTNRSKTGMPVSTSAQLGAVRINGQLSAAFRIPCPPPSVHIVNSMAESDDTETICFIHALELLGMFFTNIRQGNHANDYALRWTHSITECAVTTAADSACFNILNFVVNSLFWEEYFEQFHNTLPEVLLRREISGALQHIESYKAKENEARLAEIKAKHAQNKLTYAETPEDKKSAQIAVKTALERVQAAAAEVTKFINAEVETRESRLLELTELIKHNSLKKEYKAWAKKFGVCALPIQHFDMMYNLLKRQLDNHAQGMKSEAEPTDFWECCKTVYLNFYTALRDQDSFYDKCLPKNRVKFADTFRNCPFIQYVGGISEKSGKQESDKGLNNLLIDWLTELAKNLLTVSEDARYFNLS